MEFVDFARRRRGRSLSLLFPGWTEGEEVAFYSPHDDDAALGSGYLIQAVRAAGGRAHIVVFCAGDAGYSTASAKRGIVARRRAETERAYAALGVPADRILRFDVPDFDLMGRVDRSGGVFDRLIRFLRERRITRLAVTSGLFEHWDHTAAFHHGIYTTPQAGDPILADLGAPSPVRTYLAYAVWSDLGPGPAGGLGADKGILAEPEEEAAVRAALARFASQAEIMRGTVADRREERRIGGRYLELYRTIEVRRPIDYAPYRRALRALGKAPGRARRGKA